MAMTRGLGLALVAVLCAGAQHAAHAQAGRKAAPGPVEKSGAIYGGASVGGAEVDFEGELRLSFKGGTVAAGTLDACVSTDASASVSDRFKTALAVKGDELTGAGTTDVGRQPFTVSLRRTGGADSVSLTGRIALGGTTIALKAEDVDLQAAEDAADDQPEPAAAAVPTFNVVAVKVPLPHAREVLDLLRAEGASLGAAGLVPTCADMRAGSSQIEATVEPARASDIIGRLNAIGGVQARMSEIAEPTLTVRIAGPQAAAVKDAEIVAAAGAAVTAATGGALVEQPSLDPKTGTYRVEVQRDTVATKRLGLAERLATRLLIGRAEKDRAVYVTLSGIEPRLVDPAGKLALSEGGGGSDEGGSQTGSNPSQMDDRILARLAKDLRGQTWDSEAAAWK